MAVTFAFTAPITASFAAYPPLGSTTERLGSVAQWATSSVKAQWATNAGPVGGGAVNVPTAEIMEGSRVYFVARVLWPSGTAVAAADLDAGVITVHREGDSTETVIYTAAVAADQFVTSTSSGYWTADSTGYNFINLIADDGAFPEGGESYIVEYRYPDKSGGTAHGFLTFQGRIKTRASLQA